MSSILSHLFQLSKQFSQTDIQPPPNTLLVVFTQCTLNLSHCLQVYAGYQQDAMNKQPIYNFHTSTISDDTDPLRCSNSTVKKLIATYMTKVSYCFHN